MQSNPQHKSQEVSARAARMQEIEGLILITGPTGAGKTMTLYSLASGCAKCHNFGYQGRTGIFQLTQIDREMATAIRQTQSAAALRQKQIKSKSPSLRQDALAKVAAGITTLEEVLDLHVPGGS